MRDIKSVSNTDIIESWKGNGGIWCLNDEDEGIMTITIVTRDGG